MFTSLLHVIKLILSVSRITLSNIVSCIAPSKYKSISRDVILITGGGKGIGKKIALKLAQQRPSHIILWGRHANTLQDTSEEIKALGVPSSYMVCDVSKRENIYSCAEQVKHEVGTVTMLVNNAGVVYGQSILDSSDDNIVNTMQVNVLAHFWTLKAFLPGMLEQNRGHIVSISSVLGLMGLSGAGDYVSAKFSSTGLAESLADELRQMDKSNIKLTSVHPYHIDNTMFDGLETRLSRWLLPPLKEEYVAERTVDAVLTDRSKILMPRLMYFLVCFKIISPVGVNIALLKLTGSDKAMDGFKGHSKTS